MMPWNRRAWPEIPIGVLSTAGIRRFVLAWWLVLFVWPTAGWGDSSPNSRKVVVRPGDTLSEIARTRGTTVDVLALANGMSRDEVLRPGQVLRIPAQAGHRGSAGRARRTERRVHRVASGETLNEIAHAYGVGTAVLQRVNGIDDPTTLSPGRVLVIPGPRAKSHRPTVRPQRKARRVTAVRWGKRALKHYVADGQTWKTLVRGYGVSWRSLRRANPQLRRRLWSGDVVRVVGAERPRALAVANCGYPGIPFRRRDRRRTIRVMTCRGVVAQRGRRQLSLLAAHPNRKRMPSKLLDRRLLRRLQRVADEFPGRIFTIVSGYRPPRGERGRSRHTLGQALDFSVQGVPNKRVFDFCRRLPSTGCGYYPNSTFVHLDYREKKTQWVDYSGPGEPPDYAPRQKSAASAQGADQADNTNVL